MRIALSRLYEKIGQQAVLIDVQQERIRDLESEQAKQDDERKADGGPADGDS